MDIIYLIIGLAGLVFGGNWLITGASRIAESFRIPHIIIGLTIVAFGTSAPELLVNVSAVLNGSSDLALGNVVGSNIANIGLILGITGLLAPIAVQSVLVRREIPIMIITVLVAYVMASDGEISQSDGIILVTCFIGFNALMYWLTLQSQKKTVYEVDPQKVLPPLNRLFEFGRLLIGLLILVVGAQFTVTGAIGIARGLGISELVIGISLVAVGTSLPELTASIIAVMRKEADLAVGNVVGSNIVNILLVLGAVGIFQPISVPEITLRTDFLVMIAFSLLMLPFAWTQRKFERWESAVFLMGYVAFIAFTLLR